MKKILFIILIIILSVASVNAQEEDKEAVGIVLETGDISREYSNGIETKYRNVKVKILSGEYKDKIVNIKNVILENSAYEINVSKGDRVILNIAYPYSDDCFAISDFERQTGAMRLTILFAVLLVVIGGIKGIKSIISLAITVASIFYIFIPKSLEGWNPLLLSLGIAVFVTAATIFIVSGLNRKSCSAILGTVIGLLTAGAIPILLAKTMHLTGLNAHDAVMLMYLPNGLKFDLADVLFAGIILGALGAVMDVGMSIASAISEIHGANPEMGRWKLFKSGMNVGRDVMGTMTNTLILAYTGTALPLLILFKAYNTSLMKIFNLDIIVTEIVRAVSGSIGIVLTIPTTCLVSTYLLYREAKKQ